MSDLIKKLFLIGRPAAGKSEIIYFLKNLNEEKRKKEFKIGNIVEIDDFPMLWAWFEEDKILEEMGYPRLHSTSDNLFKYKYLWNVLIKREELEYWKKIKENPFLHDTTTIIFEFARGSEHGGFNEAFKHFSKDLLNESAILYIDVSFEESLRKNRKRFNPEKPHSILEHALSDDKLELLYKENDWEDISKGKDSGFLSINNVDIPFVVFHNEDDVTTKGGKLLENRLEEIFVNLWKLYNHIV